MKRFVNWKNIKFVVVQARNYIAYETWLEHSHASYTLNHFASCYTIILKNIK
jgi:hypothetical protein